MPLNIAGLTIITGSAALIASSGANFSQDVNDLFSNIEKNKDKAKSDKSTKTAEATGGLGKNIENVNPSEIRISQTSVNGSDEIIASMKANGWKGDPIDVVRMPDGKLTTLDNTRVAAAREAGIDVQATIRNYDDLLPQDMVARFTTPKGVPKT
ncbi:ParB/RepB/Spo0J family partition protein [Listeria cossartiae]|uniref:ParB/RepB/Spo0J family partition protein n=1 Tax=Listeria cossartiae TaxID=2838249 RepID=UPI0021AB4861|nr:ParB/RepB/Spo0J family partition protein [Listeria cossartiae]